MAKKQAGLLVCPIPYSLECRKDKSSPRGPCRQNSKRAWSSSSSALQCVILPWTFILRLKETSFFTVRVIFSEVSCWGSSFVSQNAFCKWPQPYIVAHHFQRLSWFFSWFPTSQAQIGTRMCNLEWKFRSDQFYSLVNCTIWQNDCTRYSCTSMSQEVSLSKILTGQDECERTYTLSTHLQLHGSSGDRCQPCLFPVHLSKTNHDFCLWLFESCLSRLKITFRLFTRTREAMNAPRASFQSQISADLWKSDASSCKND